jgi:glyceraldehyde-3-phosphate dehydrogenase (NAD(P))
MVGLSGDDIVFGINIPQESVTIPETIDAIRASMEMQDNGADAVAATDGYLGI